MVISRLLDRLEAAPAAGPVDLKADFARQIPAGAASRSD
jgi:hypothetical protein